MWVEEKKERTQSEGIFDDIFALKFTYKISIYWKVVYHDIQKKMRKVDKHQMRQRETEFQILWFNAINISKNDQIVFFSATSH